MQIILLIAGLIFLLAVTAPWAATVGWICLAVFIGITLAQIAILSVAIKARKSMARTTIRTFNRHF